MTITKKVLAICIIVGIVSFLGFITENVWLALKKGYMDNRNMHLPFLLGYGLAVIVLYILWGTPREPMFLGKEFSLQNHVLNTIYYIFMVALCISFGEILLGNLVEKTCKIQWWNYSELPLHIGKYTSVFTSLGFSLLITLFMQFCFTPLMEYLMKWQKKWLFITAVLLMTLMLGDFIHSAYLMFKNKKLTQRWCIVTTAKGF